MKKAQTSDKTLLHVEKREIIGKKVKSLRDKGFIPANIYGKDFPSSSISLNNKDFIKIYRSAGETQVIYLDLSGKEIPTMIHKVQTHPVSDAILHVDFRKVDLTQKLEAPVPVRIINESEAVTQKKGDLLTIESHILVEALPNDMPHEIEVDISILKEANDEIKIGSLKPAGNYVFKDDPEKVIVKIAEHKEEDLTPATEVEVAEATEEKPEEAQTEDGEKSKETPKESEKAQKEEK